MSDVRKTALELLVDAVDELQDRANEFGHDVMQVKKMISLVVDSTIEMPKGEPLEEHRARRRSRAERIDAAPVFSAATSAARVITDFVAEGGRNWQAVELANYLVGHTNITEYVMEPQTTVFQALSRAYRQGKLARPEKGVYGPPEMS